ncbi:hypothetical protein ACJH6J_11055 [Mycobacterium sp. SMC-18]|jgi:hypothetical protein|uniref:hypothetical protein n=1 Tax=Mycobacteriaceae TaxID=1762 RepID=UPI000FBAF8A4|nr:hypothetical protein [Mycolicibacterium sp.]RUP28142.1 MAG: hypothetical protein EKK51_24795 [Mycolicibacterium sp.]
MATAVLTGCGAPPDQSKDIDPSHPLGGKDGGRDGECTRDGNKWTWAVYFPRGQQDFNTIKGKLEDDIDVARKHNPVGIAFVTNQELRLAERRDLGELGGDIAIERYHLERLATILDRPKMASVRQQYLKIAPGRSPMIVNAAVAGTAVTFFGEDAVVDLLVDVHENQVRERSETAKQSKSRTPSILDRFNPAGLYQSLGIAEPEPPKVLSEIEIDESVQAYRETIEADWKWSRGHLAGAACSGLKFTIENVETSFLNNVEIVLTFTGARGVDWRAADAFELDKMQDRHWMAPTWGGVAPPYIPRRLKNYPVTYDHNDDGDLEVTITLDTLRPRKTWTSSADDIVLIARTDDLDDVTATYTVTADGYNELFEGGPITIPVERVSAFNTLGDLLGVDDDGDDE